MLQLTNIEVRYAGVILVLKGISLNVTDRQIVALLGANGAGKTTTLKSISGLLFTELGKVSEGRIVFSGEEIKNREPEEIVRRGIIQVMEGRRLFEHLTLEENLKTGAFVHEHGRNIQKDLLMVYDYFPAIRNKRNNMSGLLSGGERQMLVIGRALMGHPKLMLVDEASLGLAPIVVKHVFSGLKEINKREGMSILLVEQNAVAALDVADYGYVMEDGRVVLEGTSKELAGNEDVKEFYLGLSQVGQRKSYQDVKHYRRRKRWLG